LQPVNERMNFRLASLALTLTFDLLPLKVVSESRVTWATSVPILVFLGFSVLDLGPVLLSRPLQVSRPRPRPGQNELECTRFSRTWSRDHNTGCSNSNWWQSTRLKVLQITVIVLQA